MEGELRKRASLETQALLAEIDRLREGLSGMADSLEVVRLNYIGQRRLAEQRAQTLNAMRTEIQEELLTALALFTMPDGSGFMPEAEDVIEGFLAKHV